jgi:hypothetical protein
MTPEMATVGALCAFIIGSWLWVFVDAHRRRSRQ